MDKYNAFLMISAGLGVLGSLFVLTNSFAGSLIISGLLLIVLTALWVSSAILYVLPQFAPQRSLFDAVEQILLENRKHSLKGRKENVVFIEKPIQSGSNHEVKKDVKAAKAEKGNDLDADESIMFSIISKSDKKEMLQKDLSRAAEFSKAKVTRVLDRLVKKGLVERKTFGKTNKVKVL